MAMQCDPEGGGGRTSVEAQNDSAQRAFIVTLRPASQLITGAIARHRSLIRYYEATGVRVIEYPLRSSSSRWRLWRWFVLAARLIQLCVRGRRSDIAHVEALATPVMVLVAWFLSRGRSIVRLDACDSWDLLAGSASNAKDAAMLRRAGKSQRFLLRGRVISYIAQVDADRDLALGFAVRALIIPNVIDPQLRGVERLDGCATDRFTLSGLYSSPHLAAGLAALWPAWSRVGETVASPLPLHVFGTPMDRIPDADGIVKRGYAASTAELYEGACVVIVLNQRTSGVPNKLLEAVAAQRPMILHISFAGVIKPHPMIWFWDDAASLVYALAQAASITWDFKNPYEWS